MKLPELARERWWSDLGTRDLRGTFISEHGGAWRGQDARHDDPTDCAHPLERLVHWMIDYSPAGQRA